TVDVQGDTTVEPNEDFTVTLSNPTNGATITTATAIGTIQNDDVNTDLPIIDLSANQTVVEGKTPPTKSLASAGLVPEPVTAQLTLLAPVVLTARVTVKVKALLPLFPSVWLALVAAIAKVGTATSSFWIVPIAVAVVIVAP
ncbi:MAG: hypothetical protein ACKOQ2_08695, partial [Dolichospermum sp.]